MELAKIENITNLRTDNVTSMKALLWKECFMNVVL